MIEVSGVVAAVESLDAMCKAADVSLVTWERKLGGRLVTIIVEGSVADVTAAVEAGRRTAEELTGVVQSHIIPRPTQDTLKMLGLCGFDAD